eukprot:5035966-Amphidinium_carterae.1
MGSRSPPMFHSPELQVKEGTPRNSLNEGTYISGEETYKFCEEYKTIQEETYKNKTLTFSLRRDLQSKTANQQQQQATASNNNNNDNNDNDDNDNDK